MLRQGDYPFAPHESSQITKTTTASAEGCVCVWGIVYSELLPLGQTINKVACSQQLECVHEN